MWQTASRPIFGITENILFNLGWAGPCITEEDTFVQHATKAEDLAKVLQPGLCLALLLYK